MIEKEYFYFENDVIVGPLSLPELLTNIQRDTLVWFNGIEWTIACEIDELKSFFPEQIITLPAITYFYSLESKSYGPVDLVQLLNKIDSKTFVWREGINWTIAGELAELQKFFSTSEVNKPTVVNEIPKPEKLGQESIFLKGKVQMDCSLNNDGSESKDEKLKLVNDPISKLQSSIGMVDRFLFIREIFADNTERYDTIIDQLDKMENIQQAVDFLKANLTLQKNETSMKFVEFLKRRFQK